LSKADLIKYFDSQAAKRWQWRQKGRYYHKNLERYLQLTIPAGASVLEIGCGTGEFLASLPAERKMGIDISPAMIALARQNHPGIEFREGDLESLELNQTFDYILLVNVVGYLNDIQAALERLKKVCSPETRVIVVYFNYLWEPVLKFAEKTGLRMKRPRQNWLPVKDIENLLTLADFEVIKRGYRFLMPLNIPVLSWISNRILANLPGFRHFTLNQVVIGRLRREARESDGFTCSVVIPCRNEKGNIEKAVTRVPQLGKHTEIIFVEGHSQDGSLEECRRVKAAYPEKDIKVAQQEGIGKGDAVRKGFAEAQGDILMILDADLTVVPEDLPKFYDILASGKGELIVGSRLVYQMEKQAMRWLNLLGNKFFSQMFTFLLDQRIRDTLCGTKVLWKKDYEKIARNREYFGDFDPFGDFDLLFGAAKLNLKIVEIPVRYHERTYGTTQIDRFRHGLLLFKMCLLAMRKIKFI
jgi:SAM-dependent methyltransferase